MYTRLVTGRLQFPRPDRL